MFDHNSYNPEQSLFADESNNSINFNLFFDSATKSGDIFDFNELNCDFNPSSSNQKETKSTVSESNNTNNNNDINFNLKKESKQIIFSIEKIPQTASILSSKLSKSKPKINNSNYHPNPNINIESNNNGKVMIDIDKDKIRQIINDEIYPSQASLTYKERVYIKKLKNRIAAQRSRDKMKYHFELLQKVNESLTKEIAAKDSTITSLKSIITSCSICNEKAEASALIPRQTNANINPSTNTSFNIIQTNNGLSVRSFNRSSVGIGIFISVICCILLLFSFQTNTYPHTIRHLDENEEEKDNYLKMHYAKNNTQCCAEDIDLNTQTHSESNDFLKNIKNDMIYNQETEKGMSKSIPFKKKESFICKEYISAKLSNELNFDLIYNKNKNKLYQMNLTYLFHSHNDNNANVSRFKMIIPTFKYQNDFKSYIISLDSNDYLNQIQEINQYDYYEVVCEINYINKIFGTK